MNGEFTKTEEAILAILRDGMPHRKEEIHGVLLDELASMSAVKAHIWRIRKVLNPRGEDIVCQTLHRKAHYRWVRLISITGE